MASIFNISDDFSVVNWRRQFWNVALFSVSWSKWPITQYFKFHWVLYFNMYSFDEHTMHTATCLQWSALLKCAEGRIKDFTFSSNTCNRRQEEKTSCQGKFCVYFVNYLQFVFVTPFCRTATYLCFLFRSRSYPVPHRGERVKQRKMHARNWTDRYTNCKILGLNLFSYLL